MQLSIDDEICIESVDEVSVMNAIESLTETDSSKFVVLTDTDLQDDDLTYMQVLYERTEIEDWRDGDTEGYFLLEYQDGSLDSHYLAHGYIDIEVIKTVFRLYLRADEQWKTLFDWEKIDL